MEKWGSVVEHVCVGAGAQERQEVTGSCWDKQRWLISLTEGALEL